MVLNMLPAELLLLQFVGPSRPKPDAEWDLLTVICLAVQYLAFCFYCFFNCVYGVHRRKLRARCKLISERNETSIKNLDSIFVICAMHIFQQTFQSLTYKQHILFVRRWTETRNYLLCLSRRQVGDTIYFMVRLLEPVVELGLRSLEHISAVT